MDCPQNLKMARESVEDPSEISILKLLTSFTSCLVGPKGNYKDSKSGPEFL